MCPRRLLNRVALAATLAFSSTGAAFAMPQVLIGSYTHDSGSPGILRLRFDPESGRVEPRPLQTLVSANPSWLTLDLKNNRLYA
ncbi:MAG TPA: 3-carboxymuconate cyclase, partial [Pseudomonas sp.]|nr:3-carboxymuconate cyclase [Pseudomonas sp.]